MVNKDSSYWAARRRKTGAKFVRNGVRALVSPSVSSIAQAAWSGVKALRAVVNSEPFIFDVAYGLTSVANTAVITQLNNVAQGDTQSTRTGNSILMTKIHRTEYNTLSTGNALIREMLVFDKQQLADTAPVITDILETSTPVSLYAKNSINRFQILEDKLYTMNSVNKPNRLIRNSKMLKKHAYFNGINSSDIQKNGLYKIFISDVAVVVTGSYRLTYHDN